MEYQSLYLSIVKYTHFVINARLFMNNLGTDRTEKNNEQTNHAISLSWIENPEVQEFLNVVISIIAEEYIEIARQNPYIFSNKGGLK